MGLPHFGAVVRSSIYSQLGLYGLPGSGENPKISWVDDAEVVGDLVAVDMPVPGHFFAQKSQHRATEIL
jgi:hypothetical protein